MGSEDLFHKRKAKKAASLKRNAARRAPYSKILIVCEGEKTETNYFNEVVDFYSINTANVEICGECGSDPMSVYKYARQRFVDENNRGDPFDRVYCVFDRDAHANFQDAIAAIEAAKPGKVYNAITSTPSFEYWLLLHFIYTTQPFTATQSKSAGDAVLHELKQYMPDYKKAKKSIFLELKDNLEFAKNNAERALKESIQRGNDNPSTKIHKLVEFMENIKSQKN